MICILATLKVKKNKIDDFEDIFKKLSAEVRANEIGNIFIRLHDREIENTYHVLEHYKDKESVDSHGKSDHFRLAGKINYRVLGWSSNN